MSWAFIQYILFSIFFPSGVVYICGLESKLLEFLLEELLLHPYCPLPVINVWNLIISENYSSTRFLKNCSLLLLPFRFLVPSTEYKSVGFIPFQEQHFYLYVYLKTVLE